MRLTTWRWAAAGPAYFRSVLSSIHRKPIRRSSMTDPSRPTSWNALGHNVVVTYRQITFDEEVIVLWIENSLFDVLASESPDAVARIPEGERDDLGAITVVATQHPGALIARRRSVLGHAGPVDVMRVFASIFAAHNASPHPRDHGQTVLRREAPWRCGDPWPHYLWSLWSMSWIAWSTASGRRKCRVTCPTSSTSRFIPEGLGPRGVEAVLAFNLLAQQRLGDALGYRRLERVDARGSKDDQR